MPRSLRRSWRAAARAEILVFGMLAAAFAGSGFVARPLATPTQPDATTSARTPALDTTIAIDDAPRPSRVDAFARERWYEAAAVVEQQETMQQIAAQQRAELVARHREQMWDRLAQCETAGNWANGGDYGGGLGIYVGTWRAYGGEEFASRPQYASKAQQIVVAERIALDGMGGWGCARRLGLV